MPIDKARAKRYWSDAALDTTALMEWLVQRRKNMGITQAQMAERLDCHYTKISRMETGVNVDLDRAFAYARVLGIDLMGPFRKVISDTFKAATIHTRSIKP